MSMPLRSRRSMVFCLLFTVVVLLVTVSWLSSDSSPNVEKTEALQIFMDETLTTPYAGQMLLGDDNPHSRTNKFPIWLKNNSPYTLSDLSLIAPPLPVNCTLTWDLQNHTLKPYEVRQVVLTLTISSPYDVENVIRLGGRFIIIFSIEECEIE